MLADFVDTSLSASEVGDLLTMAGFELEGIEEIEGDSVLDIKVMSNRGDGLSVYGLAREVLAKDSDTIPTPLYRSAANYFPLPDDEIDLNVDVRLETPDCDRFACRKFMHIPPAETPGWMQKRLRQAGMRPISLLVDLTNYVMLEIGQPLHAYDLDLLHEQRIVVRKAAPGESLKTLDGNDHELNPDQMVICDADRPVGIAGVMGGEATEVSESTKHVLLEAAHFQNRSVRRTRKQLGLNTEASYRFERSVDPKGVVAGLNRVAILLSEVVGDGSRVSGVKDVNRTSTETKTIKVSHARACSLLGMEVSSDEARGYLERLGFLVEGDDETFAVTAPSWRPDVVREEDVVEEIGRVHGFDRIPETLPKGSTTKGGVGPELRIVDEIRLRLINAGLIQILSHTLRDLSPLDAPTDRIGPRVPAGPDTSYLRNSLLPNLLEVFKRNGGKDLHLFEIGKVFSRDAAGYREIRSLAILSQGLLMPLARPKDSSPSTDFFALKAFLNTAHKDLTVQPLVMPDRRFHPTRAARIELGNGVGIAGQIHPELASELSVPENVFIAELELIDLIDDRARVDYHALSRNPAVKRDITVGISKQIPYQVLDAAVRKAAGSLLEKLALVDIYEGTGVAEGEHALSFGLQLRKFGENFTDEEANQVRDSVVAALVSLGATQR